MTLRTIMVPIDGSAFAEAALPPARAVAAAHAGAVVRLVLVHSAPSGVALGAEGPRLTAELRDREEAYLTAAAERLGGLVETAHLDGDPGPELALEAERCGADLVVMATHGRGAMGRFWLGSVADHLVRHLHRPILLVRPDPEEATPGPPRFERALVPLDPSPDSEAVLQALSRVLGADRAPTVILLSVVEPVLGVGEPGLPFAVPADPAILTEQRRVAEERLVATAARLRGAGLRVETTVLTAARPAAAILETAIDQEVGLVAMTTHGEGGLQRLLLGSVTDKVIRACPVPVLLWRPSGPNGDAA